jgi:predicted unusual protein kinase regulating ubiquinone biosynthesis (AarF/ABC1/UbiB family)
MKIAQMATTVPDLLPPEFAQELASLQTSAPPMGPAFVRRRMAAELGPGWRAKFADFDLAPAAAASLGQVHRAIAPDGRALAVKLQYPDMQSAVESDLAQMRAVMALGRQMFGQVDTREVAVEISARIREELDYGREAKAMALYGGFFAGRDDIAAPEPLAELSTGRLLTMTWLEGRGLMDFERADPQTRNRIARLLFEAWWTPLIRIGVIHGDPHLGNYTLASDPGAGDPGAGDAGAGEAARLNLLDFGCIRIFPPSFITGVIKLHRALIDDDHEAQAEAYRIWGFSGLARPLIETLNIWARFIYGPLLDDRVRTVADGVSPGLYGRREAYQLKKALDVQGPVTVPREFVFMERAAIGLGAAFLRLGAEMNWRQLFEATLADFSEAALAARQAAALGAVGLV